ncbi:MAG: GMP/IMP nucleotidase [Steroidobacteraceae bacterium]|jgi:putative hydrolase of the HAD superfamily|nr:GMP/IMP nucleotidase [Steroidobacteraceae bacterium]
MTAWDAEQLDWTAIDTVLLDMDGTLLDLGFDNWFWQDYVPEVWGRERGLAKDAALAALVPRFEAARGTLEWYCVDHWSREFGLDVRELKRGVKERVAWIPGAEAFLARLAALGKRRVLVTNAHPETLAIKDAHVDLVGHLDAVYSTHAFGLPKEDVAFWPRLRAECPFDPARTLFVDDSLPVLAAARDYGIAWLRAVRRPDLSRSARDTPGFTGVDSVAELE